MDATDKKLVDNIMVLLTDLQYEKKGKISEFLSKWIGLLRKDLHNDRLLANDMIPLLDRPEELAVIHQLADKRLVRLIKKGSEPIDYRCDIIFISLALIQLEHYDANFYVHTKPIYTNSYHLFNEQRVEDYIRSVLEYYKVKIFDKFGKYDGVSSPQFIAWPLVQCAVPKKYLPKFFEFIFDIYNKNFNGSIPEDAKKEFKTLYGWLRKSKSFDVQVEDVNVAGKVYKLIKSTKNAMVIEEYEEDFIALSIQVLRLIDQFIKHQYISSESSYFSYGLGEWAKEYQLSEYINNNSEKGQQNKLNRSVKLRLSLRDTPFIELIPPIHQISCDDFRAIRIEVLNDGIVIESKDRPYIQAIIGGYRVIPEPIRIDNPLGTLEYRILEYDKILYSTKQELYRKVIVFDHKGKELKNHSLHSGNTYFCQRYNNPRFKNIKDMGKYFLAVERVQLGDSYIVDGEEYLFSRYDKPTIVGEKVELAQIVNSASRIRYDIYRKISSLVFECENNVNRIFIRVNGIEKLIDSFELKKIILDDRTRYEVKIPITSGLPTKIVLRREYNGKSNILANFHIVLDEKFEALCSNLSRDIYSLNITSSMGNLQLNDVEVARFEHNQLNFTINDSLYYFWVPWEFRAFQINDTGWQSLYDEMFIWKEDLGINSVFKCWGNKVKKVKMFDKKGKFLKECTVFGKDDDMSIQFEIGQVLSYTQLDYVIVNLCDENDNKIARLWVLMQVMFDPKETEITHDPKSGDIIIRPVYWGKGKVFLKILNSNSVQFGDLIRLENGVVKYINGLPSGEEYCFEFIEQKNIGFSTKKISLYTSRVKFYNWDDLQNKTFLCDVAIYEDYRNGPKILKCVLKNTSVKLYKNLDNGYYEGEIIGNVRGRIMLLDAINPVCIFISKINADNSVNATITKDGDGLLLNLRHRTIFNTLDNPDAFAIDSYVLRPRGV